MEQDKQRQFLERLAQAGEQASMWDIGQTMGLDRGDTEALATALLAQEALQMVSLSGKVCLTEAGRRLCGGPGGGGDLATLLADFQMAGAMGLTGTAWQDFSADVATLKAQLSRSQPLASVLKASLAALEGALAKSRDPQAVGLAQRVAALRG